MKNPLIIPSLALAIMSISSPTLAHAQQVTAKDPATLFSIAKAEGFAPEEIKEASAAPMILLKLGASSSALLFRDCDEKESSCKTVQFYAGYSVDAPFQLEYINNWNRDNRFGRAYLDDSGDPVLEMDLDLDFAGLPRANVVEAFRMWRSLVTTFEKFVRESEPAAEADTSSS